MKNKWIIISANAETKTTTIDIEGTIGGDGFWSDMPEDKQATKENIKTALKEIGAVKGDTIVVNINSYGGDVNHGLSIHDLLAQNPAKKIVNIYGMTASAATVIAMSGDEINMSDNALFLIHRASTGVGGNKKEIETIIDDLNKIDNLMAKIYSKRTGISVEDVLGQMDKNVTGEWLNAEEAKKLGFIDNIVEPSELKMAASFDPKFLAKANLPETPINKTKNQEQMKKENLVANIIAGFNGLFKSEEASKMTAEEIQSKIEETVNIVAEEEVAKFDAEVVKINAEADARIETAIEAAKSELEGNSNEGIATITNEKDAIITAKDVEISDLTAKFEAKQAELDVALATESNAGQKADPNLDADAKKKKMTANERRAEENAARLRGENVSLGEDEDDVEGE